MKRVLWLGLLGVAACASSPAMLAAEDGDRPGLARAVAAREKRGELSNDEAASLARAVADRDVRGARGADALTRVRDVRACARELDGALAFRMESHDDAGAEAALARLDGHDIDASDARDWLDDADSAWRAVGARGLVRAEDHADRVALLAYPDPRVRREAARAARDAADPDDLDALAEAARVDPEPMVRTESVRAMAALASLPPGALAERLHDLWPRADAGLREDIAIAWASPAAWDTGGSAALYELVASGHGPGAVEGAAAALRKPGAGGDVASEAVALLERAIEQGARPQRLQAIAEAPLERPELRAAIQRASSDEDLQVRVGALARLVEVRVPGAFDALVDLASPSSPVATRARFALANVGDRRVQAWVEDDLRAPKAEDRLSAATSLAAMGVAARAAPLLADDDPRVRDQAACAILVAARR